MFGPKRSSLETLNRTQDPTKGQFNFFETPFALRQVTGRQQIYENPCECVYCVLRWGCVDAASWREGCICTCFGMLPYYPNQATGAPAAP